ncbi:MAG: ATP-binding cassette domain-containing protein [Geminicoccaceae bacterium]
MSVALDLLDLPRATTAPPRAEIQPAQAVGLEVRLAGLAKSFGARAVLKDLDLDIAGGRFVAVVGRSGCGKSTLLRLLAGLDVPSQGELLLDGRPILGLPPRVRLLFQDARLLPWQRVLENVGIARAPGWRDHAAEVLRDVGLGDRAGEWPAVLSGGQRQRVALARALVSRPRLLLLDEPFGALDALTRMDMHELLARIWQRERFTTILITHDVVEAVTLADRVIVLKDGNIAFDAPVEVPRPRRSDDPHLLALERAVLAAV